ncbi:helix-turn-helix domain-containing protein [Aquimarina macrocephali]|uniref:helix-turn-helix domain-containing protein n=1 Tax=Aquimarina macrocephali TaxID=666563 RepID=UPI0013779E58|nr:helix-turn-helix domain-containing protein [Aquimarina macrocephali]
MNEEIPYAKYEPSYPRANGIEVLLIEDLIQKYRGVISSFPETPHKLEFYLLAYYTEGETEHLVDYVWHKVEKNNLVYLAKGQVNAFRFKENVKGFILLFTKDFFEMRLNDLSKETIIRLFAPHLFKPILQVNESSNIGDYIKLLYKEYYKEADGYNKSDTIFSLYTIILSKVEQIKRGQTFSGKYSESIVLFLKFITALERDYIISRNADFYAEHLNITYMRLNIVCKETIGITAKQFIDGFVILEAKRKLINSNIKSTELAFLIGFKEATNFVKYFKKLTGLTPNNFKSQYSYHHLI